MHVTVATEAGYNDEVEVDVVNDDNDDNTAADGVRVNEDYYYGYLC